MSGVIRIGPGGGKGFVNAQRDARRRWCDRNRHQGRRRHGDDGRARNIGPCRLGPVSAWTWGNATPVSRIYDTDGEVSQIITAADTFTFGYDNALRITSIVDAESYVDLSPVGYDALDRLSSATNSGSAYGWTYDANGNTLTLSGPTATTYTPSTTSNRLSSTAGALVRSYSYDAAGDTTSYTGVSFGFNQRGRMSSATTAAGATDYIYNAAQRSSCTMRPVTYWANTRAPARSSKKQCGWMTPPSRRCAPMAARSASTMYIPITSTRRWRLRNPPLTR